MLWIPITIAGAAAQVARNGLQASLTGRIGTLGATQVRFIFGLPFAVAILLAALAITGDRPPTITPAAWAWTLVGAVAQIIATALMLLVMHRRAFGVAYAYIKTEPAVVAVLGVVLLGDVLPSLAWIAVTLVTTGVLLAAARPSEFGKLFSEGRMAAVGIASGALFGLSAIAFRGAIVDLGDGHFAVRALTILVASLAVQALLLGVWLAMRDMQALVGSLREWRHSLSAGFLGALASTCWFVAFSLTPASNVRTLALVEMPMAALLSGKLTGRRMAWHELTGLGLVTAGVALLLASAIT